MRVGVGYDSHRFDPGRPLVLGGVRIPDHPGLTGHSDGDAVLHAVIDALLGAAGLGSIGRHFPDDDPELEGVESVELLARAVRSVEAENYQLVNADVTVVTERPCIEPHAREMEAILAEHLHAPPGAVCVKGKSNEGLGWIGTGEGLAVLAVALLDRMEATYARFAGLRGDA